LRALSGQFFHVVNSQEGNPATDGNPTHRGVAIRMQVDRGVKELDEGKGVSHQDVRNRLSRWPEKYVKIEPLAEDISFTEYSLHIGSS
jgi:hypothetical protein